MKSVRFDNHKYVGDPINAVKIFNDKEVDEICILDISATAGGRGPNVELVREIASEAFMPLAYGGGITRVNEVRLLISAGVEKVILNTIAFENISVVREAAKYIGSQSVVVSVDVKRDFWGRQRVYVKNGLKQTGFSPAEYAQRMEKAGAGEILLTSIERDGTFSGFDLSLIKEVSSKIGIPLIAAGGAGSIDDFVPAINAGASAIAIGSMAVFQRPHRAVLISYPSQSELQEKFFSEL